MNNDTYHQQQNPTIKAFLNGLRSPSSNKAPHRATKTVANVHDYTSSTTIQTLHFSGTLLPKYQSLLRWLGTLSERPQIERPKGDIIITIDNN